MVGISRALEQVVNDLSDRFERGVEPWAGQVFPSLDVFEEKDAIQVRVELPGVDQKDIQLTYQDGILTLKGEKRQDWQAEEGNVHRVERRYGSFVRTLSLPATVDASRVTACFKNGVLMIGLPKKEEAKPREIQIRVD